MSDTFLSRWSKRKLGQDEPSVDRADPAPPEEEASAAEPALTDEEIAALPPVESVASAEELTVFLRKGVPQALRLLALRRLWTLDPDIRNFVGDARDYAWDWNVPGGVPVSGPLEPGTDVESMVRKVFGEEREVEPVENTPLRENVIEPPPRPDPPRTAEQPQETPVSHVEPEEVAATPTDIIVRRHGGALPG